MQVLAQAELREKLFEARSDELKILSEEELTGLGMALATGDPEHFMGNVRQLGSDTEDIERIVDLIKLIRQIVPAKDYPNQPHSKYLDEFAAQSGAGIAQLLKEVTLPKDLATMQIDMVTYCYDMAHGVRNELVVELLKRLLPEEYFEAKGKYAGAPDSMFPDSYSKIALILGHNLWANDKKGEEIPNIDALFKVARIIPRGSWSHLISPINDIVRSKPIYFEYAISQDLTDPENVANLRGCGKFLHNFALSYEQMQFLIDKGVFSFSELVSTIKQGAEVGRFNLNDPEMQKILINAAKGRLEVYREELAKYTPSKGGTMNEEEKILDLLGSYTKTMEIIQDYYVYGLGKTHHSQPFDKIGSILDFWNFAKTNNLPLYILTGWNTADDHTLRAIMAEKDEESLLKFIDEILETNMFIEYPPSRSNEPSISETPREKERLQFIIDLRLTGALERQGVEKDRLIPAWARAVRNWDTHESARALILATALDAGFDRAYELYIPKSNYDRNDPERQNDYSDNAREVFELISRQYNNFKTIADFQNAVSQIDSVLRRSQMYKTEVFTFLWSVVEEINPEIAEMAAEVLISQGKVPTENTSLISHGSVRVGSRSISGGWQPYSFNNKKGTDEQLLKARMVGERFFGAEIDERIHTRRYPFEVSKTYPFTYVTIHPYGDCSFTEYFFARRLMTIEKEVEAGMDSNPIATMELVLKTVQYEHTPALEIYLEYILRKTLLSSTKPLSVAEINTMYTDLYLHLQEETKSQSHLAPLFLKRHLDAALSEGEDLLGDPESGFEIIMRYLPKPSFARNTFLDKFQIKAGLSPEQIHELKTYYLTDTGRAFKDEDSVSGFTNLVERITDLHVEQKEKLLLYILGDDASKPDAEVFKKIEEETRTDLSAFRDDFNLSSPVQRREIIQRIIYGPDGVIDNDTRAVESNVFAGKLANIILPDQVSHRPKKLAVYRDILRIGLTSVDPSKASQVIAMIVNKSIEVAELGNAVTEDDLMYVAMQSFVTGPKAGQLIADFPWAEESMRKVFASSMWNNLVVPPSEILRIWEVEQKQGFFSGYRLIKFIRPLGSAGVSQAYLVEMETPTGEVKEYALKSVKPDIVARQPVSDELDALPEFMDKLAAAGYTLDVPKGFKVLLAKILRDERDKKDEGEFQRGYKAKLENERSPQFRVMETPANGKFILLEEPNYSRVMASIDPSPRMSLKVISRAIKDIVGDWKDRSSGIHLDPHWGNIFEDGTLIDFGFRFDFEKEPQLQEHIRDIVGGLVKGNHRRVIRGLNGIGVNSKLTDLEIKPGLFLTGNIEAFRKFTCNIEDETSVVNVFKLLWLMYRLQSHYHNIESQSPITKLKLKAKLVGLTLRL